MTAPQKTFAICPAARQEAVRVMRGQGDGDESLKAQAYGHFAGLIKMAVEAIDPTPCYEARNFGELETLFAQAADRAVVPVWRDAPDETVDVIHEYLWGSSPDRSTSTEVDSGLLRLTQGVNTATHTTRRLVQAMPGFVRDQTEGEPIAIGTFGTVAHNSWRVVADRALLHLQSAAYEPRISHRRRFYESVDTHTLNAEYHDYDPVEQVIRTTVPFDDWRTIKGHRVADQAVVFTPAIGCPATLMGPGTIRKIVDIFADVATERNLPQLPRL